MEEIKINTILGKADYQRALADNVNLIVGSRLQIEMAERVIEMLKEKIAEFPEEKVVIPKEKTS